MPSFKLVASSLALLLGLVGCFGSSSSEPYGDLRLVRPDRPEARRGTTFVCAGDPISVYYDAGAGGRATLSAEPANGLVPALPPTQVSGQEVLNYNVAQPVTFMLNSQASVEHLRLELAPAQVCADLPLNLIGDFAGSLNQTEPEAQRLARRLSFVWEGRLLAQVYSEGERFEPTLVCAVDPITDEVTCESSTFSLSATLSAEGLIGTYQGTTQGSAGAGSFSGTLEFETSP